MFPNKEINMSEKSRLFFYFIILSIAVMGIAGCPEKEDPEDTFDLRGTVTCARNPSTPIADVEITLTGASGEQRAVTDDQGKYEIFYIKEGTYTFTATHSEHHTYTATLEKLGEDGSAEYVHDFMMKCLHP